MAYSVDEVGSLLGIPRPTLYRYLREYSIPHLRQAGKISIPEESLDRIREARELHKEGLGTESVRRRLREGEQPNPDDRLAERLDRLSDALEGLRGRLEASDLVSQAILRGQGSLTSAMLGLTERVDALLLANGQPERMSPDSPAEDPGRVSHNVSGREEESPETAEDGLVVQEDEPAAEVSDEPGEPLSSPVRGVRFGTLARRRRRGVLAVALVLLTVVVLVWAVPALGERGPEQTVSSQGEEVPGSARAGEETQATEPPHLASPGPSSAAGQSADAWNQTVRTDKPVAPNSPAVTGTEPGAPADLTPGSVPPVEIPRNPEGQGDAGWETPPSAYQPPPQVSGHPGGTLQSGASPAQGVLGSAEHGGG